MNFVKIPYIITDSVKMMYKHRNGWECFKKQILLIYILSLTTTIKSYKMHSTYIKIMGVSCFKIIKNATREQPSNITKIHKLYPSYYARVSYCHFDSRINTNTVHSCRSNSQYEPHIPQFSIHNTALSNSNQSILNFGTHGTDNEVTCFLKLKQNDVY